MLRPVFGCGDNGGGNDRPVTVFRLVVLPRPVFRCLLVLHTPLDLRMRDRNDAPQKVREVLIFRAVCLVAHGVIIAQSKKRANNENAC